MKNALVVLVLVVAGLAAFIFFRRQGGTLTPPLPPVGPGVTPGSVAQETVLDTERAKEVSPLLESYATWPVASALSPPGKLEGEREQAAGELEQAVKEWFSTDLHLVRGLDGQQVYLKGTDPSGTITVLVTRNRAPKLQTLAFEASYATAGEVTPQAVLKRVHGILAAPLADDIEKRGLKPTPAQLPADEAAGNVFLSPDGVGTVFPYFYYYARPKALVGILQTVPEVWQGKKKP